MKILTTAGLTKLIQLIKYSFVDKTDVVETQEVTIDTVVSSGSSHLITSGGVYNYHDTTKYDASNPNGYTSNVGTITGITMNGASKGTSGVVDLGTVITSHQDISGKENTSNKVTSISSSSTDTQYPSAKCVYDIVGNIEATLQAIRGV